MTAQCRATLGSLKSQEHWPEGPCTAARLTDPIWLFTFPPPQQADVSKLEVEREDPRRVEQMV